MRLHINFGFEDDKVGLEKKMFDNNGHMHVYSPVAGTQTDNPWCQSFA